MRVLRWLLVPAVAGSMLAIPTAATANGGAYIDFTRTHYLPGQTAVGRASVLVPLDKQTLLERGPFYAFLLTGPADIREGRMIPDGAIRLGVFSINKVSAKQFDLRVSFTVPDVPGNFYSIGVCNDPCTISGFREPLTGAISVVRTIREGQLLTRQTRLEVTVATQKRAIRKAERERDEVSALLDQAESERARLAEEAAQLQAKLAAARARAAESDPLIDPWAAALVGIGLLGLAATLWIRGRRARTIAGPPDIEELERMERDLAKR